MFRSCSLLHVTKMNGRLVGANAQLSTDIIAQSCAGQPRCSHAPYRAIDFPPDMTVHCPGDVNVMFIRADNSMPPLAMSGKQVHLFDIVRAPRE